jgi:MOSC domain-containing protein YiiM
VSGSWWARGPRPLAARAGGTVRAVCVGSARSYRFAPDREERSGIDKRSVVGPVAVGSEGLDGDVQVDRRFHGGVDRAVYAYAQEDAEHWVGVLGREVSPGLFGENLRIDGLDVSGARIGERWRTARGLVLEVTAPRMPCRTLQGFLDVPDMIARFNSAGRPGAYLRVLEPGSIAAGDRVRVERDAIAAEAPSVAEVMAWRRGSTPTEALRRLAGLDRLASDLRSWAEETLADR